MFYARIAKTPGDEEIAKIGEASVRLEMSMRVADMNKWVQSRPGSEVSLLLCSF